MHCLIHVNIKVERLRSNKMSTEFTLSYETVDNIVKGVLLELYEELKDAQEKKKANFDNLEDYQK